MYDTMLAMMKSITMPATTAKMYSTKFEGFSSKYKQIYKDIMHYLWDIKTRFSID